MKKFWAVTHESNVVDNILDRHGLSNPLKDFVIFDKASAHKDFLPLTQEINGEVLHRYHVACPGRKIIIVFVWDDELSIQEIYDAARDLYNRAYILGQ